MQVSSEITRLETRATLTMVTVDGCRVAWRHWQREPLASKTAPTDLRPPVILLHGGSGSWLHWLKVIEPLAAIRDVWCVDIPGLGDSDMPPEPHTPESAAKIIVGCIPEVLGDSRPHLVGFSFGSHVAAYVARDISHRLKSFIISGSAALGLDHPHFIFAKEKYGSSDSDQRAVHRQNLEILMFADPRNIDDLAIEIQARNVRAARFKSRIFAATRDIPHLLERVQCNVGAIWGDADNILTASNTTLERVFSIIRQAQPSVKTAVIENAGHWAAYEAADAFADQLNTMLDEFDR